jgi:hypothetical protein
VRHLVAMLVFGLFGLPVATQAATDDAEGWFNVWATGPIDRKLLISIDASARLSDRPRDNGAFLVRPLVGYQIAPKVSLWAGYAYNVANVEGRAAQREHRPTAQLLWTVGKVGKGSLAARTRLEARMFEGRRDTGWRVRQSLRYTYPLKGERPPVLVLQSEQFFHLNNADWGARSGFDQSRTMVGINVPAARRVQVEAGYMLRYLSRPAAEDRIDHIVPVTLIWRF